MLLYYRLPENHVIISNKKSIEKMPKLTYDNIYFYRQGIQAKKVFL